jgi:hypothetical protein
MLQLAGAQNAFAHALLDPERAVPATIRGAAPIADSPCTATT